MKVIHLLFIFLMLSFAALQWNDPDRIIWIGIYSATAILALFACTKACKSCVRVYAIMLGTISIIMSIPTFPAVITYIQTSNYGEIFSSMAEDKPHIELVREFLSLLIVLLYCVFAAIQFHTNQKPHLNQ